jgi:uncharacterized protein (DUF1330 family)
VRTAEEPAFGHSGVAGVGHRVYSLLICQENNMPKGYWIVRVDIADPERYNAYTTANAKPLARYGARFIVRAGKFENPEGGSRTRNAVIEFPSYQAAVDCWHSAEYQEVLKLRQPVSTADLIIIEGYEGLQPA